MLTILNPLLFIVNSLPVCQFIFLFRLVQSRKGPRSCFSVFRQRYGCLFPREGSSCQCLNPSSVCIRWIRCHDCVNWSLITDIILFNFMHHVVWCLSFDMKSTLFDYKITRWNLIIRWNLIHLPALAFSSTLPSCPSFYHIQFVEDTLQYCVMQVGTKVGSLVYSLYWCGGFAD